MRTIKIKVVILASVLTITCFSSIALGYVLGSTNLGFNGYPSFQQDHYRPSRPYSRDSFSVSQYHSDMQRYVEEGNDYVEAASNDIQRIQDAMREAKGEIADAIREHNNFMDGY